MTPLSPSSTEKLQDIVDLGMGQPGHRFVRDEELRSRGHGARQFELAHLDLGQVARHGAALPSSPTMAERSSHARRLALARRAPPRASTV